MSKWKKPRTYRPLDNNGILVIESDDGNEGDYSIWFPLFKSISYEYSQFYPFDRVPATLNVNSATIGDHSGYRRKMSVEQLIELEKHNWEIGSHGRHHIGIGEQPLLEDVSAGATTLKINSPHYIIEHQGKDHRMIYEYQVKEGNMTDVFKVSDGNREAKEIYIDRQLTNSYTTEAKVGLTPESLDLVLKGGRDDVIGWGLTGGSFAYTWHDGASHNQSETSMNRVGELYQSGRGLQGIMNPSSYDIRRLYSQPDSLDWYRYDEYLDQIQSSNRVLIVYGHGDHDRGAWDRLEYIIRQAFERQIPIMTRKEMLEKITS